MIAFGWVAAAFAGECARVDLAGATLDPAGATGLVVRGVEGAVTLTGSDGGSVVAGGTACSDVQVRLVRKDTVIYATVKGAKDADLELSITIPASIAAITVQEQTGAVALRDLPGRLAVVSSTGPIDARHVGSLRVGYGTGPLSAESVTGDLVVDQLTGPLSASAVAGSVLVDGVTGPVHVDDVAGDLAVQNGTGSVSQSNVRGAVRLP